MKYIYPINLLICFILFSTNGFSQEKNIESKNIYSDINSSTFHITVVDSVSLHFHASHTENIIVLEGSATMQVGEQKMDIQKGDYFTIPQQTAHAVWVTSETPLKVLSIQSPEFKGKDRHYLSDE